LESFLNFTPIRKQREPILTRAVFFVPVPTLPEVPLGMVPPFAVIRFDTSLRALKLLSKPGSLSRSMAEYNSGKSGDHQSLPPREANKLRENERDQVHVCGGGVDPVS
jgi:hypothetical protein